MTAQTPAALFHVSLTLLLQNEWKLFEAAGCKNQKKKDAGQRGREYPDVPGFAAVTGPAGSRKPLAASKPASWPPLHLTDDPRRLSTDGETSRGPRLIGPGFRTSPRGKAWSADRVANKDENDRG